MDQNSVERLGDVAVVRLASTVDGRAAVDFERQALAQFDAGTRRFVIDFSGVTLITSAGIRVLLLLRRRTSTDGALALCALSERVRTLLDISGLTQHFLVAATRDEAVAALAAARPDSAGAAVPSSPLGRLMLRLLGHATPPPGEQAGGPSPAQIAALAARVGDLLGREAASAVPPPEGRGPCRP